MASEALENVQRWIAIVCSADGRLGTFNGVVFALLEEGLEEDGNVRSHQVVAPREGLVEDQDDQSGNRTLDDSAQTWFRKQILEASRSQRGAT